MTGLRVELAGGLHHVTTRAPKGLVLFRDGDDHRAYLELLAEVVDDRRWSLRTYCLMTNHLHLLVMTPEADMGRGLKSVHERFALRSHRKYDGHSHVFGGRYHNKLVLTPEHEAACLRYIALNPVKAGLCRAAEEWPWSAHRFLAGEAPPPAFLDVGAAFAAVSREEYARAVMTPDAALLAELMANHPETWLVRAVDGHRLSVAEIAALIDVNRRTLYRRLAEQR